MDRGRLRLIATPLAAVVAAEVAVLLLRPRGGVLDPAPVSAGSYFSPEQIERARDFRGPQLALHGGTVLVEAAVLVWLTAKPPRALRQARRRPLAAAAVAGAGLSLVLTVAPLPLGAAARARAVDVGLVTQSWGGWGADVAKSAGIGAVLAGAGAALVVALMRRFGGRWWLPGSALAVALSAGFLLVGPVVLDPLFNRFTPLPPGEVRTDVLRLAREAGVDVGEVYVVDASRRTTAINAYVNGIGATKRVVLYDNLIEGFSRDERNLVVAHELAHVHFRDVPRGLLFLAIVAPLGLAAAATTTRRLAPAAAEEPGPAVLPALALSLAVISFAVGTAANGLSRRVEARADTFALRLTRAPEPFIAFQRRVALRNVSDPDPPRWARFLLGTHPTTLQRIGIGLAYERSLREPGSPGAEAPRHRRTPAGS